MGASTIALYSITELTSYCCQSRCQASFFKKLIPSQLMSGYGATNFDNAVDSNIRMDDNENDSDLLSAYTESSTTL